MTDDTSTEPPEEESATSLPDQPSTVSDETGADTAAVASKATEGITRRATKRARYLARTTDLSESACWVVAYSELGFSSSGIARRIDLSERRVKTLLEDIADKYGPQAVWPKPAAERGDLTPRDDVGPADLNGEL